MRNVGNKAAQIMEISISFDFGKLIVFLQDFWIQALIYLPYNSLSGLFISMAIFHETSPSRGATSLIHLAAIVK
jgi:hypothetical protein